MGDNQNYVKSVLNWIDIFKQLIHLFIQNQLQNTQLFGDIEIDETLIYKLRRGANGRLTRTQYWIFGLKQRGGQVLVFPVVNRTTQTLVRLVRQYVRVGSTIYSDCWGAYFNNRRRPRQSLLRQYGYNHLGINHTFMFVNRYNPRIHTNTIERCWRELKKIIRRDQPRQYLNIYISQFMWEQQINKGDRMLHLLSLVKQFQNNT